MVLLGQAARVVVLLAVVWSAGCAVAAVNWHSNWSAAVRSGGAGGTIALHAQERFWHWAGLGGAGLLVALVALVAVGWRTPVADHPAGAEG